MVCDAVKVQFDRGKPLVVGQHVDLKIVDVLAHPDEASAIVGWLPL